MARSPRKTTDAAAKAVADKYIGKKGGKGEAKVKTPEEYELSEASLRKGTPPPEIRVVTVVDTSHKISAKEALFIEHYAGDCNGNGAEAVRKAGYPEKAARQTAYELLTKPYIQRAIQIAIKERLQRVAFNSDVLLLDLLREHRADLADIFDEHGALKPIHDMPLEFRSGLIAGFEVEELWAGSGEHRQKVGQVTKVKLADRTSIKKMIGDHIAVQAFKKRVEMDVPTDSPLAQLARELNGSGLRPREIEGTSRPVKPDGA